MRLTSLNFITHKRTLVAHLILIADCCCCSCNWCWSKQRGNRLTTKEKCLREGSRGVLQAAAGSDGGAHALESLLRWSSCLLAALPPAATRTRSRTMTRAVNAAEQSLPPPCAPSNATLAAPDPQFESQIQIQALWKTLYCHRWLFSVHELSQHGRDSTNIINDNSMTEADERRWCYEFLFLI